MGSSTWRWSCSEVVVTVLVVLVSTSLQHSVEGAGTWKQITANAGIASMHSAVTPNAGTLVLLDHTNTGPSNITFPDGRCRVTNYDRILKNDCFAHSVLLDPVTSAIRPLMVMTDTWCSSGNFVADGSLQQTGGDYEGAVHTRSLSPECYNVEPVSQYCDWQTNNVSNTNTPLKLRYQRWYSTNVLLPDGRQILFSGRNGHFTNEYSPPLATNPQARYMKFLEVTEDGPNCNTTANPYCAKTSNGPNNWYPFAYLLPNNCIFLFANRYSIMYDHSKDVVVREYPKIPGNPRNYPSGGSSVMLPMRFEKSHNTVEVVVCGGATSTTNTNAPASVSCGKMTVTDAAANWTMENMPIPRAMSEMILLPDANVLLINGGKAGYSAWRGASLPALNPVLYEPNKPLGQRFTIFDATTVPRMYHSTANLLTDGTVAVAGSNPNQYNTFTKPGNVPASVFFPTELSVESFLPPYNSGVSGGRPTITTVSPVVAKYATTLTLSFVDDLSNPGQRDSFLFTINSAPWSTHGYSMGQRMLTLKNVVSITTQQQTDVNTGKTVNVRKVGLGIPYNSAVLPPAYYMLWAVKNGNPSVKCIWVRIVR